MKCIAPWKALSIRFNGDIVPDCVYTGRHGNIYRNTMSEIFQNVDLLKTQKLLLDNKFPNECIQCYKKEEINNHSRRIFFNQILSHVPKTEEIDVRFLEFNISNKCNLQCLMCSGVNSTSWVKLDHKLNNLNLDFQRPVNHPDFGYRIIEDNIVDKIFEESKYFKNLEYVNIKGGEPYMESRNIDLLKKLINLNLNRQITLDISTNGSIENLEFEELALQFKTKWHISIEGTGKLYEYIRGGNKYSWEQFDHNLNRFDKFDRVIISGTVMTYNVCHLDEIKIWFEKKKKQNYELYLNNVVTSPPYLDPTILPNFILADTGFVNDINKNNHLKTFIEYTKEIDNHRGTDILTVCPELHSIFS